MLNNELNFGIPDSENVFEDVMAHVESATQCIPDSLKCPIPKTIKNKIQDTNYDKYQTG